MFVGILEKKKMKKKKEGAEFTESNSKCKLKYVFYPSVYALASIVWLVW